MMARCSTTIHNAGPMSQLILTRICWRQGPTSLRTLLLHFITEQGAVPSGQGSILQSTTLMAASQSASSIERGLITAADRVMGRPGMMESAQGALNGEWRHGLVACPPQLETPHPGAVEKAAVLMLLPKGKCLLQKSCYFWT